MQLTVAGVAVGVVGALGINQLIASVLFGVKPTDLVTVAFVSATISLAAAIACWLPAWRASRLDPMLLLKHD